MWGLLVLLGLGGVITAAVLRLPGLVFLLAIRAFSTRVEIRSSDDAYWWMERWLSTVTRAQPTTNLLMTTFVSSPDVKDASRDREILLTPAPGIHRVKWRGKNILIERVREKNQSNGNGGGSVMPAAGGYSGERSSSASQHLESFVLRIPSRDREFVKALLEDVRESAQQSTKDVIVRTPRWSEWCVSARITPRVSNSVILPGRQLEDLIADARQFKKSREWYQERGVPYRRGYLLHGAPGSGKTSCVHVLASELGWDVYSLDLSSVREDVFSSATSGMMSPSILLIEDIDTAFKGRQSSKDGMISFASVLNAIDGMAALSGRVVCMTTNHIESLDPALIRAGRIDVRIEFKHANKEQAVRLFKRFFPEQSDTELPEEFGDMVAEIGNMSMSELQELCVRHRDDELEALATLALRCRAAASG
jgi:chaperone BCS1